jgi:hypothetical protein
MPLALSTNELSMRAGEQPRERLACSKGGSRNIDIVVTGLNADNPAMLPLARLLQKCCG